MGPLVLEPKVSRILEAIVRKCAEAQVTLPASGPARQPNKRPRTSWKVPVDIIPKWEAARAWKKDYPYSPQKDFNV
ncbi:hypothetical protein PM082_018341 [Marasmius tenuissimus]|nr:hypothetical protein PM082_018341 [Marasmius tenuissimus]